MSLTSWILHQDVGDASIQVPPHQSDIVPLRIDLLDLPRDVIIQIFSYACSLNRNGKNWTRGFHPLSLGAMCRAWREIAWAASELWTTIVVEVHHPHISGSGYLNQKNLLEQWLARTKGRPLDIIFGSPEHKHKVPYPIALMTLLINYREQWNSIELHLPESWQLAFRKYLRPLSLPNLRNVSLNNTKFRARKPLNAPPFPGVRLPSAPLLRSLSFSGFSIGPDDLARFPRHQITHIALETCPNLSLETIFTSLTFLRHARLSNMHAVSSSVNTTHERLSSLVIESSTKQFQGGTYQYFRQLTLPALKNLEVRVLAALPYTGTLGVLVQRSTCMLTTLTLECPISLEYDLIDCLYTMPSLQELYIVDKSSATSDLQKTCHGITFQAPMDEYAAEGLSSIFFEALHPDQATPFLPNLVVFSYTGPLTVRAIDFIDPFIVRSRMRDGDQSMLNAPGMEVVAVMKKATIKANQYSDVAEFSISEYSDPHYIWEMIRMIEEGVLLLTNMDGTPWC